MPKNKNAKEISADVNLIEFNFPEYDLTVLAESIRDAEAKLQEILKSKLK